MSKRHVAYVKPEEPSFLKKLKEQAGYQEGPTVDTKREDYGEIPDEDLLDTEDEKPTVVVLKPGDLTAEEAANEEERLRKEEEEKPADLNARIIFKAPNKSKKQSDSSSSAAENFSSKRKHRTSEKGKTSKKLKSKTLLSFNDEEDEEQ